MKKKRTEERSRYDRPAYTGYELSSVSEYYLYGRGNAKDYERAVKNVREDIRERAYGERNYPTPVKKKINASAVFTAIFAFLAIVFTVVGMFLPNIKQLSLAGGNNALALWQQLFGGEIRSENLSAVAITTSLLVAAVLLVVTFLTAICRCRKRKAGGLLKLTASLSCLAVVWTPLALVLTKSSNGIGGPDIGMWILTALTLLTALSSLIYKQKTEE